MKKLLYATLFALLATAVHGQTIYNLRAAYDIAHPNNYVIDFNNYGPDGTFYPSGLTAPTPGGNITFTGIPQTATSTEILASSHFGINTPGNFVLYDNGGQFLQNSLLITLPANTFSFGTDIISPSQTLAQPYLFTIFSGSNVLGAVAQFSAYGSYTFVGFDSLTDPITSIQVQISSGLGNPEPVLDNFTVVPEPSTWLAATLMLGMVGYSQRRRVVRAVKLSARRGFHVNMFKLLFVGLVIVAAASAVAETINFDDLNGDGSHTIQNGYAGLNWDNVFIYDATNDPANLNPSGYQFSVISPNNVAFTGYGNPITVSSDTVFNLNSAYLTAVWKDNLQVKVIGSLLGAPIYVNTYSLSATEATPINFNYLGIDSVQLSIFDAGTQHPGYGQGTNQVAIDNLNVDFLTTLAAVPEPSTWLAAALALGVIGFSQRKRLRACARVINECMNRAVSNNR